MDSLIKASKGAFIEYFTIILSTVAIFIEFKIIKDHYNVLSIFFTLFSLILFSVSLNLPNLLGMEINDMETSSAHNNLIKKHAFSHLISLVSISLFAIYFRLYLIGFMFIQFIMLLIFFMLFLLSWIYSTRILPPSMIKPELFEDSNTENLRLRSFIVFLVLGLGGILFLNFGILIATLLTMKRNYKSYLFDPLAIKIASIMLIVNWTSLIISYLFYWHVLIFEQMMIAFLLYPFFNGLVRMFIHYRLVKIERFSLISRNWKIFLLKFFAVFFIALLFFSFSFLLIFLLLALFPSGFIILLSIFIILAMLIPLTISTYIGTLFKAIPIKISLFLASNSFILTAWVLFYWGFSLKPEFYSLTIYFEISGSLILFKRLILKDILDRLKMV